MKRVVAYMIGDLFLILLCLASWFAIVTLNSRVAQLDEAMKSVQDKQVRLEKALANGGY